MIILKSAFNNGMRACWSLTVNTQLPLVCVLVCEELKCTRDYEMTVENGVCIVMRLHLFRELHVCGYAQGILQNGVFLSWVSRLNQIVILHK